MQRLTDGAAGLAEARAKSAAFLASEADDCDCVTVGVASEMLGLSYETVDSLVRSGWLPLRPADGRPAIPVDAIESYKREQMKLSWAWETWDERRRSRVHA